MNASVILDLAARSLLIGLVTNLVLCMARCWTTERFREVFAIAALVLLCGLPLAWWLPAPLWQSSAAVFSGMKTGGNSTLPGLLWLAGCAAFLARDTAGWLRLRGIQRRSVPACESRWAELLEDCQKEIGLHGRVELRFAPDSFGPSAAGLFVRRVFLPADSRQWPDEWARFVLLHELAHFRRGDLWGHHFARLVCALYWFNPFAWQLQHRLALEREHACDALVAARCEDPIGYAALLLDFAGQATPRNVCAASLTMATHRPSELERRIRLLLQPGRPLSCTSRVFAAALFITSFATLLALAACSFVTARSSVGTAVWTRDEVQRRLAANPFPDEIRNE
jgi:beta-lactamase regulating signal transducer with metallopeptidase domain